MPGEEPTPDLPASPRRDQMIVRLQDLDRLRDLTEPYVTDASADFRADALPRMPEAERAEAEEILARIGILAPTLAALRQELLGLIAEIDVVYREVLDREQARGAVSHGSYCLYQQLRAGLPVSSFAPIPGAKRGH